MRPSFVLLSCLGACGPGVSVQPVSPPAPAAGTEPVSFEVTSLDLARGRIAVVSAIPLTVGVYLVSPEGVQFLGVTTDSLPTEKWVDPPRDAGVQSPFTAPAGSQNTHYEGPYGSRARQVAGGNRVCTTIGGDPDASASSLRGRTICSYSAGVPASLSTNPATVRPPNPPVTLLLVGAEGVVDVSRFRAAAGAVARGDPAEVAMALGRDLTGDDRWGAAVVHARRHRPAR